MSQPLSFALGSNDIELLVTSRGPALRIARPHLVLQLSENAAAVLRALPGSIEEIAARTTLSAKRVNAILETFEKRRIVARSTRLVPTRYPMISVVIPAYGRPDGTRATIASVLALEWPRENLELIVVDDATPTPLDLADLPIRLHRLETNGGPAAARNVGFAIASGEIVAFLDNDCIADPRWLAILVAALEEPGVDLAGGRAIAPAKKGIVAAYEAARSPLDMGKIRSGVGLGELVPYLPTTNLLVRRTVAQSLGGFRAGMHLGEDVDFIWRAAAGSRIVYEPAAIVVHDHRERLSALLYRRAQYASSEGLLAKLHPASRRTIVLPITAIILLAALAWSKWSVVPAAVGILMIAFETLQKRAKLGKMGISKKGVVGSVVRAHGASLFHLSAVLTRYYGMALLIAMAAIPSLRIPTATLLLVYPVVDARIRRPALALPLYVGLYTLEMTAYRIGVIGGRLRHRYFGFPRFRLRR